MFHTFARPHADKEMFAFVSLLPVAAMTFLSVRLFSSKVENPLKHQLVLYGKVARAPDDDALRKLTFMPGTLQPVTERFVRKTGRPRHEWASQLNKEAMRIVGVHASLEEVLSDEQAWKQAVHRYCFSQ